MQTSIYSLLTSIDINYTRILQAILNKSWRQHPTKQQLYSHLLPITKTIQISWTRHAGLCWRSKYELRSDILLWAPAHRPAKVGQPARTYIQELCANAGYSLEDLPGAMDDRDGLWKRVGEICASIAIWWWWWFEYARPWFWSLSILQFNCLISECHKVLVMGYSMRLELTLIFSLNGLWLVRRFYRGVIHPLS